MRCIYRHGTKWNRANLEFRSFDAFPPFCIYCVGELLMNRREFLVQAAAATVITSIGNNLTDAQTGNFPYRTLGRTGEKVSLIGIGGYHLGSPSEQESIRIVRTALDNGVNFLDNCWDYNSGLSEERMGKALRDGYRQKAFLMTK